MGRNAGNAETIGVVVADRHEVFLDTVNDVIAATQGLALRAGARSGFTALQAIREHGPAVAVLDLGFADLDGFGILNAVDRDRLETRCVFVAGDTDAPLVVDAIAAGAAGWLDRDTSDEELVEAIRRAAAGSVFICARAHTALVAELVRNRSAAGPAQIDDRAREVLQLSAHGMSPTQIARELNIALSTVRGRLHSVYKRLGVSDRTAAVAEALRQGFIT